jgi:hypothetical protein
MGVSVRMITRVLAQVIEGLGILHDSAGSLGQSQEFIELSLNEPFWNVVRSESGPKFIPGDNMTSRLHGPTICGQCREVVEPRRVPCSHLSMVQTIMRTWTLQCGAMHQHQGARLLYGTMGAGC